MAPRVRRRRSARERGGARGGGVDPEVGSAGPRGHRARGPDGPRRRLAGAGPGAARGLRGGSSSCRARRRAAHARDPDDAGRRGSRRDRLARRPFPRRLRRDLRAAHVHRRIPWFLAGIRLSLRPAGSVPSATSRHAARRRACRQRRPRGAVRGDLSRVDARRLESPRAHGAPALRSSRPSLFAPGDRVRFGL